MKSYRVLLALLLSSGVTGAWAQAVPDPSPPHCVSCGPGYHCVHDPEGCEADDPPEQPPQQPQQPQPPQPPGGTEHEA